MSDNRPAAGFLGPLRRAALIALAIGAVGAVGLMLYAGRNAPRILIVPFVLWVVSPFVALLVANRYSQRWSVPTRAALYGVMLVVTVGTLAVYAADIVSPRKAQGAFVYVAVPPASWALSAAIVTIAALIGRRRASGGVAR